MMENNIHFINGTLRNSIRNGTNQNSYKIENDINNDNNNIDDSNRKRSPTSMWTLMSAYVLRGSWI